MHIFRVENDLNVLIKQPLRNFSVVMMANDVRISKMCRLINYKTPIEFNVNILFQKVNYS